MDQSTQDQPTQDPPVVSLSLLSCLCSRAQGLQSRLAQSARPRPRAEPPPALAPVLQQPQPQQTQVQPTQVTQPAADTPTDRPHRRQRGQPGARDVQPVTGELRQPGPSQQPQPLTQPSIADPRCLSAFPKELVGFNSGIFFARLTAVGERGFLPPTVPYSRAFNPRLPASLRQHAGGLLPLPLPSLPHAGMLQVIDQTRRRLAHSSRVS